LRADREAPCGIRQLAVRARPDPEVITEFPIVEVVGATRSGSR
jgi:hypothetical protein